MDRRSLRYGCLVALAAVLALLPAAGCRTLSTTLAYLLVGPEREPEFPGLKGKKVVVVCRPLAGLEFRNAGADRLLARQVGVLLQAKVPKIVVVDQQKVAARTDENSTEDYAEIGRALKADMVVGVEMTSFNTLEGQTLWRGRADVSLKVFDLGKEKNGALVWEKELPQSLYPPNIAIPMSDKPEGEFRKEFIGVLADQIGRHFYAHDPYADYVQDARAGL